MTTKKPRRSLLLHRSDEAMFTLGVAGLVVLTIASVAGRTIDASLVLAFAGLIGVPVFRSADRRREGEEP